ncbi:hypothetical protein PC116_g17927 [Phytophthora cactorum]|uniref:Uncharacterized protein n=1 Tax=Phytophthora cactorum TaxID=29920 RepID=A0A8T0YV43_9STRA|nr:hypothetical protein Pcac1_g28440 [Phytophthora cactorum]KAG2817064.1 hypothetical protein PC112_g13205 [Phytophthora cactorum]KAG2853154.1 hypothetical protein PC113_g14402 [Phytophthora cactorum]KAG2892756.1 hypothetical protein PC114_g16510 [Phytophthora cactorum]KAG2917194.1 hypothetical protein PC115_g10776 [Phytophthora cactorum]
MAGPTAMFALGNAVIYIFEHTIPHGVCVCRLPPSSLLLSDAPAHKLKSGVPSATLEVKQACDTDAKGAPVDSEVARSDYDSTKEKTTNESSDDVTHVSSQVEGRALVGVVTRRAARHAMILKAVGRSMS